MILQGPAVGGKVTLEQTPDNLNLTITQELAVGGKLKLEKVLI